MKIVESPKTRSFILVATMLASFGFISHAGAQQRSYLVDLNSGTATELGSLGGGRTVAHAFNKSGQVVGSSTTSEGVSHAFVTGPRGVGMRDIGTLGGGSSTANDINDAGQVVGKATTAEGQEHAFITYPNGLAMRDLGTLGGHRSEATAIDSAGQVVGLYNDYWYLPEAPVEITLGFITGPNGTNIQSLGGAFAQDINSSGQMAGYGAGLPSPFPSNPVIGPDGGIAINESGQVAGYYYAAHVQRAFITAPDAAGMRDLGTLGGSSSFASGINDAGQAVGWSHTSEGATHAFITGPDGMGMTDLNSLVGLPNNVVLTNAVDINNAGQVVVDAVPEPEAYAMLLAGLGLVGFMPRLKKNGFVCL